MFGQKSYCDACDRLCLDTDKIEEMIGVTENQKKTARRPVRAVLLVAAMVAALGITASAAEIPAVQKFFANIFVTVSVTDGSFEGLAIPTMAVERREGRTLLILDREEIDVTNALDREGEYLYEGEGYEVHVDANGVAVLTAHSADGENVFSFSTAPNAGDGPVSYNVMTEEAVDPEVQTGLYNIVTDDAGSVAVIDEEGQFHTYTMKDGELTPAE